MGYFYEQTLLSIATYIAFTEESTMQGDSQQVGRSYELGREGEREREREREITSYRDFLQNHLSHIIPKFKVR